MKTILHWAAAFVIVAGLSGCSSLIEFYFWPLVIENDQTENENIPA